MEIKWWRPCRLVLRGDDNGMSAAHPLHIGQHSAPSRPSTAFPAKFPVLRPPLSEIGPQSGYSNTHPNPLQNPLGVCVPVYKNYTR